MPQADLAGWHTAWREAGDGPLRALLVHCSLAHSGAWSGVMSELGDAAQMWAMDLPGHGRSAGLDDSADFQVQAAAMAGGLIDRIGPPVHMVGHSFGATVAFRLALERPGAVASLVLIEPPSFGLLNDAGSDAMARWEPNEEPFRQALEDHDYAGAARAFTAVWGAGAPWEALSDEQRAYFIDRIRIIHDSRPALFDGSERIRLKQLAGVTQPVLLIEGSESPWIIAEMQETLARTFPNARRVRIKGAGHMAPITHAADVAAAIRTFWAEVAAAGAGDATAQADRAGAAGA